jgi:hypothetical protein
MVNGKASYQRERGHLACLSACGGEAALRGRIALPLGIEEVGKMPTLLEDTGGPPVPPF